MKKRTRKILFLVLAIFLLIQLYQPARNRDGSQASPSHITSIHIVPDSIKFILETSCYDCHSNNTKYPWYSYIQPARYFMERHIKKGKKELNFSEFGNYSERRQESKLESMSKQVNSGKMPLASYTWFHRNSKLTLRQKEMISNWIDTTLKNYE
jgi:hypothetical protein